MKIKLDEDVTTGIVPALKKLGHDVETASEEGLTGKPDSEIWSAAQSEARFLITQDMDFADARRFTPGTHHGVLLPRLHSPNQAEIIARLTELFSHEDTESWRQCFVVATEQKVRVRRR
jgi:predicted nuclease of predicted toxin-antitoxin system